MHISLDLPGTNVSRMKISKADPSDHYILSDITFIGKSYWNYDAAQMEKWRPQLTIASNYIEANETYKLRKTGPMMFRQFFTPSGSEKERRSIGINSSTADTIQTKIAVTSSAQLKFTI